MTPVANGLNCIRTDYGVSLSYTIHGSNPESPPLVLIHGAFSDHRTNWEFVLPALAEQFRVYAVARRGRGGTDDSPVRRVEDEASDVVALIKIIGAEVYLLGHSYGAHVALLAAAALAPGQLRKLILYEPPAAGLMNGHMDRLEAHAREGDWSGMSYSFFHDVLCVPTEELDAMKNSELWVPILDDARAALGDLRALSEYDFRADAFRKLSMPVMLQIGSESPRHLYATDTLAAVLPDVRIQSLAGQAHEGMTTAPQQYVDSVAGFFH
ncbi:MAG TPA: alpha/beta hydrolase [Bryobacteraceae bacterium]|nr:alpha/beta hydrolase [Bryobacteraceae bacterium]